MLADLFNSSRDALQSQRGEPVTLNPQAGTPEAGTAIALTAIVGPDAPRIEDLETGLSNVRRCIIQIAVADFPAAARGDEILRANGEAWRVATASSNAGTFFLECELPITLDLTQRGYRNRM